MMYSELNKMQQYYYDKLIYYISSCDCYKSINLALISLLDKLVDEFLNEKCKGE